MLLDLTTEQATLLHELLAEKIGELASEARHTDATWYRAELREQERMLESVLMMLMQDAPPTNVG